MAGRKSGCGPALLTRCWAAITTGGNDVLAEKMKSNLCTPSAPHGEDVQTGSAFGSCVHAMEYARADSI